MDNRDEFVEWLMRDGGYSKGMAQSAWDSNLLSLRSCWQAARAWTYERIEVK